MGLTIKRLSDSVKKTSPGAWGLIYGVFARGRRFCLRTYYFIKMRGRGSFLFTGKKMPYFGYSYNNADDNERTIEVPIIYDIVKKYRPDEVLEIGNVLSHYYDRKWDVVDKFEKGTGVTNEDIADFKPGKRYRLAVSISTFEHIGYDEHDFREFPEKQDSGKILEAVSNVINNCLSPDGLFVITIPLGHNAFLDEKILSGDIDLKHIYFLRRISGKNEWEQCGKEDVMGAKYDHPFKYANAVAVCATKDLKKI